jgi:hypothetical protein
MYEIEIHKLFSSSSNLSKKRKIKIGKSKWTWKNLTAKEKKIKFLVTQKEENCKWKWGLWDWENLRWMLVGTNVRRKGRRRRNKVGEDGGVR